MDHSTKVGFSFGLTSGVITTLGLMVGLNSGTHNEAVVLGGIVTIAIADAASDAMGIHVSEESEGHHTAKEIWTSTLSTFFSKFFFALTFVIPVLLFDLDVAVLVGIAWGILALGFLSYRLARNQKKSPVWVLGEHILIAVVVVVATHLVGLGVSHFFG